MAKAAGPAPGNAGGMRRRAAPLAIYLCFAAGYLLSYLYRTANAVLSPQLVQEFGLSAGDLGLLTSAYFLAFGLAQLPLGIFLDRFGPRRVESLLLVFAASGATLFAYADSLAMLTLGRGLIGLGVAACLMAALKGFVLWFPPSQRAALSGWIMSAGGAGALLATAPLEALLREMSWRAIFLLLGGLTLATALALRRTLPEEHGEAKESAAALRAGVRRVLASGRFWWIAPLGGLGMGGFMAVQGLWSLPWLTEVEGLGQAEAARVLFYMSAMQLAGYLGLGAAAASLARRGWHARHLFLGGFSLHILVLGVIVAQVFSSPILVWMLYGFSVTINVLGFNVLAEGYDDALAGRSSTALNLMMFAGSFAAQWGIGALIDVAAAWAAWPKAQGLRFGFALLFAMQAACWLWFVFGWRRHTGDTGKATA